METNKKIVIFLSDSDVLMARVCKNKFQKEEGWGSVITDDYNVAIKEIKEIKPNVVLTDIILNTKDKNGFDLVADVRGDESLKNTKIIVFTELNQESDKEKAKNLGADEYFVKSKMTIKEVIDEIKKKV